MKFFNIKKIILISAIMLIAASCDITGSGVLGVVKTLDGGSTWQSSDSIANSTANISNLQISEMQFQPGNNSQGIYLSALNDGLWQSTDAAGSWKQILSKISVFDFAADSTNTKNIYTAGIFNNHGKIVATQDGGATWNEIYNEASINNAVNTITVNPNNSHELYAGLASGVFIKSTDGGQTWFVAQDFKDFILKARFVPLNGSIYVLLRTKGVAKSTDGGRTWNFITGQLTNVTTFDRVSFTSNAVSQFVKIAIDDRQAGVIYITTGNGLYKTIDDGKSWSFINMPIRGTGQLPRAIASTNGGMLAYTSIGSTLFKTVDGGQAWQTQGLPTTNIASKILIDPNRNQTVYIGLLSP